jgi:hypothetical protein
MTIIRDAESLGQNAARATRLSNEPPDPLTRERLRRLLAGYLIQAIESESGGQTVSPDIDPTE